MNLNCWTGDLFCIVVALLPAIGVIVLLNRFFKRSRGQYHTLWEKSKEE